MIDEKVEPFYHEIVRRNPGHPEFHQADREVLETLGPVLAKYPEFAEHKILERLCEPERQIIFRVAWQDDTGEAQINRGFGVEFRSALGPYKGGLALPSFGEPGDHEVPRLRAGVQEQPDRHAHRWSQG